VLFGLKARRCYHFSYFGTGNPFMQTTVRLGKSRLAIAPAFVGFWRVRIGLRDHARVRRVQSIHLRKIIRTDCLLVRQNYIVGFPPQWIDRRVQPFIPCRQQRNQLFVMAWIVGRINVVEL
jgi:hypothetical protein